MSKQFHTFDFYSVLQDDGIISVFQKGPNGFEEISAFTSDLVAAKIADLYQEAYTLREQLKKQELSAAVMREYVESCGLPFPLGAPSK